MTLHKNLTPTAREAKARYARRYYDKMRFAKLEAAWCEADLANPSGIATRAKAIAEAGWTLTPPEHPDETIWCAERPRQQDDFVGMSAVASFERKLVFRATSEANAVRVVWEEHQRQVGCKGLGG